MDEFQERDRDEWWDKVELRHGGSSCANPITGVPRPRCICSAIPIE